MLCLCNLILDKLDECKHISLVYFFLSIWLWEYVCVCVKNGRIIYVNECMLIPCVSANAEAYYRANMTVNAHVCYVERFGSLCEKLGWFV